MCLSSVKYVSMYVNVCVYKVCMNTHVYRGKYVHVYTYMYRTYVYTYVYSVTYVYTPMCIVSGNRLHSEYRFGL